MEGRCLNGRSAGRELSSLSESELHQLRSDFAPRTILSLHVYPIGKASPGRVSSAGAFLRLSPDEPAPGGDVQEHTMVLGGGTSLVA